MHRQVFDLYATSVDYDPKSSESIAFSKWCRTSCIIQFLVILLRRHIRACGCSKPFIVLANFSEDFPTAKNIGIAKNYLTEDELKVLNNIVSGYFNLPKFRQ